MERGTTVRADIVQALDDAVTVAVQDDLLAQNLHAHRFLLDLLRDACTRQNFLCTEGSAERAIAWRRVHKTELFSNASHRLFQGCPWMLAKHLSYQSRGQACSAAHSRQASEAGQQQERHLPAAYQKLRR